jgi:hypothetical protein
MYNFNRKHERAVASRWEINLTFILTMQSSPIQSATRGPHLAREMLPTDLTMVFILG